MMRWLLPALGCLLLVACHRTVVPGPLPPHAGPELQRDAGYALLVDLLEQEARVDGLFAIRTFPEPTERVIGGIAEDAGRGAADLRAAAGRAPAISLETPGLPTIEMEARNLIANRTSLRLLASSGADCELELLLAQDKAVEYVLGLSAALQGEAVEPERIRILKRITAEFLAHHEALRALLRDRSGA